MQEQDSAQRSDPNPIPQCRPLGHSCRFLGPSFYLQSPFNFWKSPDALTPYGDLASSQTPGRCGWWTCSPSSPQPCLGKNLELKDLKPVSWLQEQHVTEQEPRPRVSLSVTSLTGAGNHAGQDRQQNQQALSQVTALLRRGFPVVPCHDQESALSWAQAWGKGASEVAKTPWGDPVCFWV